MSVKPLQLPPLPSGKRRSVDEAARQIIIVGANGAGKSRFAAYVAREAGSSAFPLSALYAIFERTSGPTGNAVIDRIYDEAIEQGMPHEKETTQFERVLTMLMRNEMLSLLRYKLSRRGHTDARLPFSQLDTVIDLWEEVFPGNRILTESGRLLFTHDTAGSAGESYSSSRLSAGEKAVLYYIGAMTFAPKRSTVFVDSPEMLLHPTVISALWNHLESMRPDCRFVYTTHDLDFAASRSASSTIWVRGCDPRNNTWDYEVMPPQTAISDEIYRSILGSRKPVIFTEGDGRRSIDAKLYPLIFHNFTIQALGSCNKVIEATRTFNDLNAFHHMDSLGIVDRDRRDVNEVEYLRRKRIMVPDVAEVENILLIEEVVRAVATFCGKDENTVAQRVKKSIMTEFRHDLRQQALLHTRHKVKRLMECRIDGRFDSIEKLERHLENLPKEINPRGIYNGLCKEFQSYLATNDYASVLRVYNQKSMLPGCNVAGLCGLRDKDDYLYTILKILRRKCPEADRIRQAVLGCFRLGPDETPYINDDKEENKVLD